MAEAIALQVVVLHLADALDAQRLPRQILAGAPAALRAGHAVDLGRRLGPLAPRMALERVHAQRRQLLGQLLAHRHRERRRHADVLQAAAVVVEAEQQRADLVVAALVPAEAGDDAVGGARVLDLDHRALARLVGGVDRLGDHAVEAGALEALEPLGRQRAIVGHRREVDRRGGGAEQPLEPGAAFVLRQLADVAAVDREQIEGDERRRRLRGQLRDPRRGRVQAQLQAIEVEPVRPGDDDLAVDHAAGRERRRSRSCSSGK